MLSLENGSIMDIQTEKLRLIEWIAGLNDTEILKEFITLKKRKEVDWWDGISAEERSEIEEGLAQADRGEVVTHEKAMEKYKKWL
ncbi:hypothetical protein SAMN04488057_12058 [Cyclobacterium lianum]|uniref:Addiction module component n=1 Tax=Cyclobacterium lianum TaxID=388280 RepID=A0A1M7QM79_9BACT|nr:hypothetical protein [Cyclobacterium lianum]SHN32513.1 hypothetical protein SAMN04488057_12058 [Cyclobacterium lianum]